MKTNLNLFLLLVGASSVGAFTCAPRVGTTRVVGSSALYSEKPNDDQETGSLDLDLEEMFTMFDAAAKEEKFDDALKKVKNDSK